MKRGIGFLILIMAVLLTAHRTVLAQGMVYQLPVAQVTVQSAEDLKRLFDDAKYTLAIVRKDREAPRIFVQRLPLGLAKIATAEKESLFIRLAIPLVTKANKDILAQRRRLLALRDLKRKGQPVSGTDQGWLQRLATLYKTKPDDLDSLAERVDIIPAALATAQAIDESGWGTGRLAIASNGLFGQHAPSGTHNSVAARSGDNKVSVAAFSSLLQGVYAYMFNINVAAAYKPLRAIRAKARNAGKRPRGSEMALGLKDYSSRGVNYVNELRALIRYHRLDQYEALKLAKDGPTNVVKPSR